MYKEIEKFKALIDNLNERAKELNCLYNVEDILKDLDSPLKDIFSRILDVIHPGWQFTDICKARIIYRDVQYTTDGFLETEWVQNAQIYLTDEKVGSIEVFYIRDKGFTESSPFLVEEQILLDSIAEKLSHYLFNRHLKEIFGEWEKAQKILKNLENNETKFLHLFENASPEVIQSYLEQPKQQVGCPEELEVILTPFCDKHWKWRLKMADLISQKMDFNRFAVKAVYIFGSVKNGEAGPASDIDLLIHFHGDSSQLDNLKFWLDGWSLCLAEFNFLKTGFKTDGLLDYHIINDEDIKKGDSFAIKINAVSDAARLLRKL